ncbi:hypothetical protein BDN71DRAFT_1585659 [Pleurotus eryngii]|uniref:Uncharacterized protein n=1 Tax=Pleurotus eryngii TaxID=5323 RepID=A0A9P6DJT7_PLEER|nr:hypothetical protein BDN71DRAFT_1585659 [Pleurotus eryngii]
MEAFSPLFTKLRTLLFSCIIGLSFLWILLLSLDIFLQWEVSGTTDRSFLVVFLLINAITIIMLPIMMLREFRPWLDAARFLLLSLCHIGFAVMFSYWNPRIQCPDRTPDQEGVCKLLNLYLLVASWIIPVLLIVYMSGLACVVSRRRARAKLEEDIETPSVDRTSSQLTLKYPLPAVRRDSVRRSSISTDVESESAEKSRFSTSTRRSTRLSKRLPDFYFS